MSADYGWAQDLEQVFSYGNRVSPRGQLSYELLGYQSRVNMSYPIILNTHRNLGYKFMAAEAAWILSGKDDVASIRPFSKEIAKFSDDGVTFFGAYGPKVYNQLSYVITMLQLDPETRQAVVNIWRENPQKSKDIPCTLSLQWLIRHNTLHCVANMRSSDLWLGHPYDVFNFSAISFYVMLHLNQVREKADQPLLELGVLHLNAGSKHIYERNSADVSRILEDHEMVAFCSRRNKAPFEHSYDTPEQFVEHLWEAAHTDKGILWMT